MVLIGPEPRRSEVSEALSELKVSLHHKGTAPDGPLSLPAGSCALVLVTPIPRVDTERLLERLLRDEALQRLPLLVIVEDGTPDRRVRALYETGATAVFEWPAEATTLAELTAERLGIAFARGLSQERDSSLSRTVRAHLRTSAKLPSGLKLSTHRGVVEVRGKVDSLWRKRALEEMIRDIPGVRRVVTQDVHVQPTPRPDATIEASIRSVLSATSEIAEETVAVSSSNGYVTLAGSAEDREELERILELVTHVRGVRGIEVLMTISPKAKSKERAAARRLQRGIERLLHEGDVKVTLFGDTAVLNGEVRDPIARGLIEHHVCRDEAVRRVVNKVEATGAL